MAAGFRRKHLGIRGRVLGVAIVLIVLLPLLIFSYNFMLRRELFPILLKDQLGHPVRYCFRLRSDVERDLRDAHRLWFPGVPLNARGASRASLLLYQQEREHLSTVVRLWFEQVAKVTDIVKAARVVDLMGRPVVTSGSVRASHESDLIQVWPGEHPGTVLDRLVGRISEQQRGAYTVFMPVRLGERYVGGVYFELAVGGAALKAKDQIQAGTARLLRMSLFATSFLALLAAYVVRLNDQTRDLQTRLEQEKQMASVGRLAAGLAHEIRTPLNSLGMNLQMLQNRLAGSDNEHADYINRRLDYICREATRLEVSVDDFLALARPAPPQMAPLDVNDTLDEVLEFVSPQCNAEGVEIVTDYDDSLPTVNADAAHLGQAMQNLIRNARQALSGKGRITIRTRKGKGYVNIGVADNGPGISEDEREKVLDVFYTTKTDGTGLGLCIVKRIAEEHGGEVTVGEAPGGGAVFTIRLPVNPGKKR